MTRPAEVLNRARRPHSQHHRGWPCDGARLRRGTRQARSRAVYSSAYLAGPAGGRTRFQAVPQSFRALLLRHCPYCAKEASARTGAVLS